MNGSATSAASPTGRYSRIAGTGGYLPAQRLTNAALAEQLAARGVETRVRGGQSLLLHLHEQVGHRFTGRQRYVDRAGPASERILDRVQR